MCVKVWVRLKRSQNVIGFRLINLIVPGDPQQFPVNGGHGAWSFDREPNFAATKHAILNQHQCGETYVAEHAVSMAAGAAVCDAVLGELLPICLGASLISGESVTVRRSIPHSDVALAQIGSRFPRERSFNGPGACVNSEVEFTAVLEAVLQSYSTLGQTEKIRLIVHHWLDAMSCWSLEDLYLSATTILQIIAATEETISPIAVQPSFYKYVTAAAGRHGVPALSQDFKNMRNDLIHDGTLSGSRFPGKTGAQCRAVVTDVMNWIDSYLHAALNLGAVRKVRFDAHSFDGLNAYSL